MSDKPNNWDAKAITTVSILMAISVIISIIIFMMPFLSILMFLVSIPIIIIGIKFDLKMQLVGTSLLALLLLIIEPSFAINVITSAGFIGIIQGYLIKKEKKASEVILYGSLAYFFGLLISIYLINILANLDILDYFRESLNEMTLDVGNMYRDSDVLSESETSQLLTMLEQTKNMLTMLLPTILFLTSLVSSVINFVIARAVLVRLKFSVSKSKFKDFRIGVQGKNTLYITLLVVMLVSLIDTEKQSLYIMNFSSLVLILFLTNGLSLIWHIADLKPNTKSLKILTLVSLFIIAPLMGGIIEMIIRYGIVTIGIADIFYDFRSKNSMLKR